MNCIPYRFKLDCSNCQRTGNQLGKMTRFINVLLIVLALVGMTRLLRERQTLSELKRRHAPLAATYGVLEVTDPSKYVVQRLETGDPQHFLWRCYFPARLQIKEMISIGPGSQSSGSSYHLTAGQSLTRCRFDFRSGGVSVHNMDRGGGGRVSISSGEIAKLMKEHWEELEIEVLASDGAVELPIDQALPFLTVRIPKQLIAELPEHLQKQYSTGPLFQMLYGTEEAVEALQERQAGSSP
jgi:hypothetical protein